MLDMNSIASEAMANGFTAAVSAAAAASAAAASAETSAVTC